MHKLLILSLIIAITCTAIIPGAEARRLCSGNQTVKTYVYPHMNITEECDYGCDSSTGRCNPVPLQQNLMYVGVIGGIVFLAIIARKR